MGDAPEQWREIPGFPDYQVSDLGRVRSWRGRWGRRTVPRPVKAVYDRSTRYFQVTLCSDAGQFRKRLHVLVLEVFRGPKPEGLDGAHFDGNRANNALNNLRWCTRLENARDRIRHNTQINGERQWLSKLKEHQAEEILLSSASNSELAEYYEVDTATIYAVRVGINWKHTRRRLIAEGKLQGDAA